MKTRLGGDKLFFSGAVLASIVVGLLLYEPFLALLKLVFGPITGFHGLTIPKAFRLRIAVLDFAYVFFLAFFLSFRFDWQKTIRYWAYGYLLLMAASLLAAGIYIPNAIRLLFILVSASVGFLLGQGINFLIKGKIT